MSIPAFDDIVFGKLNKKYGAYFLRKSYNRTMIISILAACIIVSSSVLIIFFSTAKKSKATYSSVYITMENISLRVEPEELPQLPVTPSAPRAAAALESTGPVVRYIAPKIVDTLSVPEKLLDLSLDSIPSAYTRQDTSSGEGEKDDSSNILFYTVDEMPKFGGGDINKFREWVQKKTIYPDGATKNGIQGKVYLTFVVEIDGSVTNGKIVKGVDSLIDEEALKVVMSSPKWAPGRQQGIAVRVSYIIILNFKL
jgi:protein TonB